MNMLRSRAGAAITTLVCLAMGSLQSFMYFLNVYPDALKDLMINQQIGYGGSKSSEYLHSTAGKIEMKKSSVTFVGVGKTADKYLVHNLLQDLDELSHDFASSRAIFVIDSSSLSLQQIFNDWAKQSPLNRTILIATAPHYEEKGLFPDSENTLFPREGKIAQARNIVLEEYNKGVATDYMLSIDLDIVGWDQGGIRDSFGQHTEWDVVCANGVLLYGIYRDAYAVRAPGIMTNHHLSGLDFALFNISTIEKETNRKNLIQSKKKVSRIMDGRGIKVSRIMQNSPNLVKLDSCFGGLAIYKTSAIEGCKYTHRADTPPMVVDCEHVFYHKCMAEKNQARIVSNRNMKLWYGHASMEAINYSKTIRAVLGM